MTFKRRNGKDDTSDGLTQEQKETAVRNSLKILNVLPNFKGNRKGYSSGSFNYKKLKDWVKKVREMLNEAGLKERGDECLGQYLSTCTIGTDGVWPHESIRDIVEDIQSEEFDHGLLLGIINSRGFTTRSPFEGGVQERKLASKYKADADKIKNIYPRTASVLRNIAKSYESNADREDKMTLLEG